MDSSVSAVSLLETVHFSIHIWQLARVRDVVLQIKLAMHVRYNYKKSGTSSTLSTPHPTSSNGSHSKPQITTALWTPLTTYTMDQTYTI
jgi:hypothetical protein